MQQTFQTGNIGGKTAGVFCGARPWPVSKAVME
jgi:hypothetical protein